MRERSDVRADALPADLLQDTRPVLLRGLVRHWPLVQAAGDWELEGDQSLALAKKSGRHRVVAFEPAPLH